MSTKVAAGDTRIVTTAEVIIEMIVGETDIMTKEIKEVIIVIPGVPMKSTEE